jgi:hypothetical protein
VKYLIAVGIFVLILLPMTYERLQATGQDGLVSHMVAGVKAHEYLLEHSETGSNYYIETLQQTAVYLAQYLGWVMIPNFVFFVPIGILVFLKINRNKIKDPHIIALSLFVLTMLIPASYAYSRGYQEPRYLLILFPVFCMISAFTIKQALNKIKRFTLVFLIVVFVGILIGSLIYVESRGLDNSHQKEAYLSAIKISELVNGINTYSEFKYVRTTYLFNQEFPTLKNMMTEMPKIIPYDEKSSFTEYILQNKEAGLTHIVTDGLFTSDSEIEKTLNDVFTHEESYQYLRKVYDSSDDGFKYQVKVFEIDYDFK